jgi:hypothetical protein
VNRTRDWFSYAAGPLSTVLALIAAALGLCAMKAEVFTWWLALGIIFVLVVIINRWTQSIILNRFAQHLHDDGK